MTRPSGARWSSAARISAPPLRDRSPRTRRRAGSTRSRRARRGGTCSGLRRMTSRRNVPSTRVASLDVVAGCSTRHRVVAEVRKPQVLQQQAAVGVRVGAHPALALRREREHVVARRAVLVEQLLGPVRAHPGLELREVLRVLARARRAAPGASATCPRPAARRPPSARSSPSACAARSSARRALAGPGPRWIAAILERLVERRRHALVHRARARRPRRRSAGARSPRSSAVSSSCGIRASTVGLAIL